MSSLLWYLTSTQLLQHVSKADFLSCKKSSPRHSCILLPHLNLLSQTLSWKCGGTGSYQEGDGVKVLWCAGVNGWEQGWGWGQPDQQDLEEDTWVYLSFLLSALAWLADVLDIPRDSSAFSPERVKRNPCN